MKTYFKWHKKEYQVDIDILDYYNSDNLYVVELPNGELLEVEGWIPGSPPQPVMKASKAKLIATEVDSEEVAFQKLLRQYSLTDNSKTRKLWHKCYQLGHSGGVEGMTGYFHDLVDLLIED